MAAAGRIAGLCRFTRELVSLVAIEAGQDILFVDQQTARDKFRPKPRL
jgi:hypothetical protein